MNTHSQNNKTPSWRSAIIAFAAIFLIGICEAATIEYAINQSGSRIFQTANVAANKVFVKGGGGDPDSDVLFDADRNILFVVDHHKRSYLEVDYNAISQVAALSETVTDAISSDNGVISEALENLGLVGASHGVATTIDTGNLLAVGGYPCSLYRSYLAGDFVSEICMADNKSLNLSVEDFNALRSFWIFSLRLLIRAEHLLAILGVQLPRMEIEDTGGLPIAIYTAAENRELRLTRIHYIDERSNVFSIPKNYTRSRIPFVAN